MLYDEIYDHYCQVFNTDRVFIIDWQNETGNLIIASEDKIQSKFPLNSFEESFFKSLVKTINEYNMYTSWHEFAITCSTISDNTILFNLTLSNLKATQCFDYETKEIIS